MYSNDSSPDDNVRGGAIAADAEIDTDASAAEPQAINDDVAGFTDWREELRERLKRIRARREEEQLTKVRKDNELEVLKNQSMTIVIAMTILAVIVEQNMEKILVKIATTTTTNALQLNE